MNEETTNEEIFARLAPLRGDLSTEEILDAIHEGRAEREFFLFKALGTD